MKVDALAPRSWVGLVALVGAWAFLGGAVVFLLNERSDAPPDRSSADVGFLQDMIVHHQQALALSTEELFNGEAPEVQVFAREILQQQSWELGMMDRQLAMWGLTRQDRAEDAMGWMGMSFPPQQMPGMADDRELDALEQSAGSEADALFLALMIDHHRGGVSMARAAAASASDEWVREAAERMARNQELEISEMDATRERLGLPRHPPGHMPGPFPEMTGHGS